MALLLSSAISPMCPDLPGWAGRGKTHQTKSLTPRLGHKPQGWARNRQVGPKTASLGYSATMGRNKTHKSQRFTELYQSGLMPSPSATPANRPIRRETNARPTNQLTAGCIIHQSACNGPRHPPISSRQTTRPTNGISAGQRLHQSSFSMPRPPPIRCQPASSSTNGRRPRRVSTHTDATDTQQ